MSSSTKDSSNYLRKVDQLRKDPIKLLQCRIRSNSNGNDWANVKMKFDPTFFDRENLKHYKQCVPMNQEKEDGEEQKPVLQFVQGQQPPIHINQNELNLNNSSSHSTGNIQSDKLKIQGEEPNEQEKQLIIENEDELCQDALQLEAFYYQLTEFGFTRSPMLSLPAIVSYYIYSILTFDLDAVFQYCNKDVQLFNFFKLLGNMKLRKDDLYLQSLFQSKFQTNQIGEQQFWFEAFTQLLFIYPKNIQTSDIDEDILIKDLELYSKQYIKQKESIRQFLDDSSRDKNNILLANIRFTFKYQSTEQILQFRYPISEFDLNKWLDCKNIFLPKQNQFIKFYKSHSHSEKALLIWLLVDAFTDKIIFEKLKKSLIKENIIVQVLTLITIQIELTSENRLCNVCVGMLNKFPISFYCDRLIDYIKCSIEDNFYLIFLQQYFVDPRYKGSVLEKSAFSIIEYKEEVVQEEENQMIQTKVQKNKEIRYFIIQKELEPTGLISKRMFDYRYKKNRNQFKTEIDKVILQNTFFLSCSKVETSKSSSSKSSKSRENRLLDSLDNQKQKFGIFKQAQEYNNAHQIVQAEKTLDTLVEEFTTSFQSTLIKKYCSLAKQKNFSKFQIYELITLFEYIFLLKEISFRDPPVFRKILSDVEHRQIIFNQTFNRSILIKDYLFLKSLVTFPLYKFMNTNNEIHNEFSIKIFSNNLQQNNWQEEKLNLQGFLQINNCVDFTKFLQNILENCNLKQNEEYQLIICTLYEIDQQCQNQIIHFFQGNKLLNQLKLIIKFIAIGMEIEQESQQNVRQITIQNQSFINFLKSNILSYDGFLKRYKINQDSIIRYPFNDTQNLIQNSLPCFDCQEHDKLIQVNINKQKQ